MSDGKVIYVMINSIIDTAPQDITAKMIYVPYPAHTVLAGSCI